MPFFRKNISFLLWAAVIIVLAAATFVEKYCGTDFAHRYIYGSWWFVALWAALALFFFIDFFKRKSYKNVPLFLLHLSFVVILAGALCTKLRGECGQIILQQNAPAIIENIDLPFTVSLDTFYIQYYAGTNTPADYVSEIRISSPPAPQRGECLTAAGRVSMNNIYSHKGYRFYQSSFMSRGVSHTPTTVLSINHDPVGIAVTYAGYALFVLAGLLMMIWRIFLPQMRRYF
jgi:cytochrome c biogenesis protein ResB